MGNAILASEVFGMISLLIILYGVCFESKHRNKKKNAFIVLAASVFVTLAVDAVSYLPVKWEKNYYVHFAVTLAAFVMPFFVYSFFLQYIYMHISAKAAVSRKLFSAGTVYCVAGAMATVIFGLKDMLFSLDNGIYSDGEYYNLYLVSYVIVLGYTVFLIGINRKKTGWHDSVAAVMFIFIPIIFIVINLLNNAFAFSVSSLSLAMLAVNTMLQAEREHKLIEKEKRSSVLAHMDQLTSLQNRLAYSEVCRNIDGTENSGVVFADVNGLKYANDHFGHKAGDLLICEFSGMLLGCFRKDDIFRISGDEFVVIITGISEESFDMKVQSLIKKVNDRDVPIASVGYIYGNDDIRTLIETAEEKMYIEKKLFHEKYTLYSRA